MLSDTGMTGLLDFLYLKEHLSLPADVIPITTLVLGRSHTPGPVVPPRINRDAVVMRNAYREPPQEILEEWFDRMKVGFILLYPFAGLSSKISYYHERMETAERELRGIFLEERE